MPARRSATSTRRGRRLKYYGEWFGPYPYGHITIIDPAYQSGAGGMEYPTLFTAGTRWLAPARVTTPEGVTVHEAGHQFWYGMVANNEFEDAWMDEGFNTYSTARAIAQVYDPNYLALRYFGGFVPWVFKDIALSREIDGNRLPGYRRDAEERRAVDAVVPVLPGHRRQHHLQQDGAVAEHDGTLARVADDAAHHVHAFRAVEVQASEAGRLLRRGERGGRPRSRAVLRPGVSQLERLRLRRAGA